MSKTKLIVMRYNWSQCACPPPAVGLSKVGVYLSVVRNEGYFDRPTKQLSQTCLNGWADITEASTLVKEAEDAGFEVVVPNWTDNDVRVEVFKLRGLADSLEHTFPVLHKNLDKMKAVIRQLNEAADGLENILEIENAPQQ